MDTLRAVEDRIDRVLADWHRLRPDLDFSPVGVVARLRRVRAHLDLALEAVYADYGLTGPDFEAIVILRRREPPYRASQAYLGRWLGLTPGTISVRIDRLVDAGLVRRERDPGDARSTLVRLSRKGQGLFDRVAPAHLDNQQRLLAALSPAERETLAALLRKLLLDFEGPAELPDPRPPAGSPGESGT